MRGLSRLACVLLLLAGCATTRPPAPVVARSWDARLQQLQHVAGWQLGGRAAVALGTQGWQASLDWRENNGAAELHLAGPLGIGAQVIKQSGSGLSLNGAPPSAAALAQLQDRLGFALPIDELKFWLLGVPDPGVSFDLQRNDQDRAQHIAQAGWQVDYDRYMKVGTDLLPARMVLTRDDVRVRLVIDHWDLGQ